MLRLSGSLSCACVLYGLTAGFALAVDRPGDMALEPLAIASALHPPGTEGTSTELRAAVVAPIKRVRPKAAGGAGLQPAKSTGQPKGKAAGSLKVRSSLPTCRVAGPGRPCGSRPAKGKQEREPVAKAGGKTATGIVRVKGSR
jgi:hypothetical protein